VRRLPQPYFHTPSPPHPQRVATRPPEHAELEVLFVARVAVVPAPDLRGGAGVPYERRDLAARATTGDPISAIGRARCLAGAVEGGGNRDVPLRVEPLPPQGNVLVRAERAAGVGATRV